MRQAKKFNGERTDLQIFAGVDQTNWNLFIEFKFFEFGAQKNVIGKNTIEAMNSGVYFGYISLIEGLIAKIETELNHKTTRIITGGLAEIFKDALKDSVQHHEPDLTLDGLRIVYEMNKSNGS